MSTFLDEVMHRFRHLLSTRLGEDRVSVDAQLVKLQDEVQEVLAEPSAEELADVIIVAMMAGLALDVEPSELLDLVTFKMGVNLSRNWYPTASGTARHTPEE